MRIGIYCGHFAPGGGYGGGEKHTVEFLRILNKWYDLEVMIDPNVDINRSLKLFRDGFGVDLSGIPLVPVDPKRIPKYDTFINLSHGILLPPLAKRNILVAFFPQYSWNTTGYDTVIGNSLFTSEQIRRRWDRDDVITIYPPSDLDQFVPLEKKNIILTVGRFFFVPDGNNKKHDVIIKAFQKLNRPDYELHLVGTVQHEDYYQSLKELVGDDPRVHFHHDISREELSKLYGEASFYWHAAGYEACDPSMTEHFGLVTQEAMSAGAIPLVYAGGGITETGALLWKTPDELIRRTNLIANDLPHQEFLREEMITLSKRFTRERAEEALLDCIERPIAIFPVNINIISQTSSRIEIKRPESLKIGFIGDSPYPYLTTGFSLVAKMMCQGLIDKGHRVVAIGMWDPGKSPRVGVSWPVWRPSEDDRTGMSILKDFLDEEKPDVLVINYDPGMILSWLRKIEECDYEGATVAYFPVEGMPIPDAHFEVMKHVTQPITYLKWASDLIKETRGLNVPYVPHGVDHAPFTRYSDEVRAGLKSMIGWDDKFVVGFVGRNKRTKQHPKLILAMKKILDKGIKDVVMYLHCSPFEGFMLSGWNLREVVRQFDVQDYIRFPEGNFDQWHGVSYDEPSAPIIDLDEFAPPTPETIAIRRQAIMNSYTMIERYNLMDIFVCPSQVEGFNLPLAEAMACGVPVVAPADGGAQEELVRDAGILLKPVDWDLLHNGCLLANVSIDRIVEVILKLREDADLRKMLSIAAIQRAEQYKWKDAQEKFEKLVVDAFMRGK